MISISQAVQLLQTEDIVAVPTETVYGLAGNATSPAAVNKIFQTKQRPVYNPLIIHVAAIEAISSFAHIPAHTLSLLKAYWPGPLTAILPLKEEKFLAPAITANLPSVAVRLPNHPIMREILKNIPFPLAAPSPNISGTVSPTTAQHVVQAYAGKVPCVDGGACSVGIESTIVDLTCSPAKILRPGILTFEDIQKHISLEQYDEATESTSIKAPGQLKSHYAPKLPLRLNATHAKNGEAFLGFGPEHTQADLNLSSEADLAEAAFHLFSYLQELDQPHRFTAIAVAPIPTIGIGVALNNRLVRAAAPKKRHAYV